MTQTHVLSAFPLPPKNAGSRLRSSGSVTGSSLYALGVRSKNMNSAMISATTRCVPITKIVDWRKPIESYSRPLTDGPMKAPSANVDVHRPEIKP